MKQFLRLFSITLTITFGFWVHSDVAGMGTAPHDISIIPQPNRIIAGTGTFELSHDTALSFNKGASESADFLQNYIFAATGQQLKSHGPYSTEIELSIKKEGATDSQNEGYSLAIDEKKIKIAAATETGLFYGVQTLRQLLPRTFEEGNKMSALRAQIPILTIEDEPRFKWRAYMLDEARFFQGTETVKRLLDQMALLKMNIFHWHLVDDQGWRIEIKNYPKLTEIGSVRSDSPVGEAQEWRDDYSDSMSGKPHSGYYTQNEIRDIVRYAAARHITIVPEIELPGHASAAIAAYPWLGTDGKSIKVPTTWGVKKAIYNVANAHVRQFHKDVLDEVMALFPSRTIHIGGDEAKYDQWHASPEIQAYMQEKGITNAASLQVNYTNEVSDFLAKNGRRMMGWNEILGVNVHDWQTSPSIAQTRRSSLATNAIIHFWKGDEKLILDAVNKGHDVVNSTHQHTYLDYKYSNLPLHHAYGFDPIPSGLPPEQQKKIIGLGAQMWGEFTPDRNKVEDMTFPRIAAYAEVAWTNPENKSFPEFKKRLQKHAKIWDTLGIKYRQLPLFEKTHAD